MNAWRADFVQSVRLLATRRGFAATVIVTLALGIGANCAIFSAIDGLLLQPLPYPNGERLVYIYNSYPKMSADASAMTVPDYLDRRDQADALEDSALYYERSYNLAGEGPAQHVEGIVATPSLFSTLQVDAALGRTFTEDEAETGRDHVAVLADSLWRNRFNADPAIVGRDIRLNSESYRVVGVMPAGFGFPDRNVQIWTAFAFTPRQKSDAMRGFDFARAIGRLKPGASRQQLEAQFALIIQRNAERFAAIGTTEAASYRTFIENSGFAGRSMSLRERLLGKAKSLLLLLQAAAALVLLIACANVANLMLLHVSTRQREWALRAALGAGRIHLARRLLTESALLALAGGVAGLAVAQTGIRLIQTFGLDGAAYGFRVHIDLAVLAFAFFLAVCATLLFGLAPLWSMAREPSSEALKQAARGSIGSRRSRAMRNVLVISQIALSCVLLTGAVLLMRSFVLVQAQDPGFVSDRVLTATVHLPPGRYATNASAAPFHERLIEEIRTLPGVEAAGIAGTLPFAKGESSSAFFIDGQDVRTPRFAQLQDIDDGFFRALRIPLLRGRGFQPSDDTGTEKGVIVDDTFARRFFPSGDALGQRIATRGIDDKRDWQTIVGVVADVKRKRLDEPPDTGTIYLDFRQNPVRQFTLVMKTRLAGADLIGPLRVAVSRVDPDQSLFDVRSMNERIDASLDERRTPLRLLALFAGVALLLAATGIYGVLAHGTVQRSGEIGLRMALGARRGNIHRLVMAEGGRLIAVGLALGIPVALMLGNSMRAWLFGVDAADPPTLMLVLAAIVLPACLACWLPARRAARVDPVVVLRDE